MTTDNNNQVTVGIRPWGTKPPQPRFEREDLPKLPFLKLKTGINNMRIVTDPGVYFQARWKAPNSTKPYGDRVRTSYPTYPDCPVKNDLGLTPKERFMVVVIDREDNTLKLFDMSVLVEEQIETLLEFKNAAKKGGAKATPKDFDISVKFNPKAKKATGFYATVANDTVPMDDEDLKLIQEAGGVEMLEKIVGRQIVCPKPETVRKRLTDLGWDGKSVQPEEKAKVEEALEAPTEDDYAYDQAASA